MPNYDKTVLEEIINWFEKFKYFKLKTKSKAVSDSDFIIKNDIEILGKSTEEIYLDSFVDNNSRVVFNSETYKRTFDLFDELESKMNFMLDYQTKRIAELEKEISEIDNAYKLTSDLNFSIATSASKIFEGSVPLKKTLDYQILHKFNCDVVDNNVVYNGFGISKINDLIINKVNTNTFTINFKSVYADVYSVYFKNIKTANSFIINVKDENGKTINIVDNKRLPENALIKIALKNISEIVVYSEADISYIKESIIVKSFDNNYSIRKGFYVVETTGGTLLEQLYINSDADTEVYLFDLNYNLDYNVDYDEMKKTILSLKQIPTNIINKIEIISNFKLIVMFNTEINQSDLIDIFYL